MGTVRTSQLFHKPLQPLWPERILVCLGMVSSSGICLCLFGYMSVFCFFLKALFVQANYEKEQKMVPLFSEKTEVFRL